MEHLRRPARRGVTAQAPSHSRTISHMGPRPRVLFLCQTMPYPPDGGAQIRTYHVLRLLARTFDVTMLCFERTRTTGSDAAADRSAGCAALGRFASVEVFPIPQLHSRIRYGWDHFRSLVKRRVYTTYLYDSADFRRRLAALLKSQSFDLVHVDSLDLAEYLPQCSGLPVVCVHHDVEPLLLRRRAAFERSAWRRAYMNLQARLRERVETSWCPRVALNVAVSEEDRVQLKRFAPEALVSVVPNGVDLQEFHGDGSTGTGVAFVGGTTPFPNLDALNFFCKEVLPHLRAVPKPPVVRWIGRASPGEQQEFLERHGIQLTGYVDDVRPFMREAACHIVPLRIGGGTRLKILNAWALGKPVVSTSLGCEGLRAVDGENILVRDDPREFAKAIVSVLGNETLRRQLGARGRATVERLYSWDVIGEGLVDTYLSLASVSRRNSATAGPAVGTVPEAGEAARPATPPQ